MTRNEILQSLKSEALFDLLIIGGGATGCGIALDAASRGLRVALVERYDLAEGTSSKSTKLVHGGVRYLEAAVKKFDKAQYHLVKEALFERGVFLNNAPHLAHRRALVTPIYQWLEVPYVYAGLLLYDFLAGKKSLGKSLLISAKEAVRRFPALKKQGLKAGVIYYDGQFNDVRMAVSLALTAQQHGAFIATHCKVQALQKSAGTLIGAEICDALTGESFAISARGVINATGPFVDQIRQMDEKNAEPILKAASGIHIILPKRFVTPDTGLLIPKTEDGRVLFVLPWQGHTLVGTTDNPAKIVDHPKAQEEEINYVLRHVNQYFNMDVKRSDVTAAWSGLRPLLDVKANKNTAQIVREHALIHSASGLLSIAGGKWTSYRKMAEEAVNEAIKTFALNSNKESQTAHLKIFGGQNFNTEGAQFLQTEFGLAADIAAHLHEAYGDQAPCVAALAKQNLGARLHLEHPYIEAEVIYAVRCELALRANDVLTRRLALALLDNEAAKAVRARVVDLMAQELAWDAARCQWEMREESIEESF